LPDNGFNVIDAHDGTLSCDTHLGGLDTAQQEHPPSLDDDPHAGTRETIVLAEEALDPWRDLLVVQVSIRESTPAGQETTGAALDTPV
jgi:hypothetical protein